MYINFYFSMRLRTANTMPKNRKTLTVHRKRYRTCSKTSCKVKHNFLVLFATKNLSVRVHTHILSFVSRYKLCLRIGRLVYMYGTEFSAKRKKIFILEKNGNLPSSRQCIGTSLIAHK